jgi:hypothetical protein
MNPVVLLGHRVNPDLQLLVHPSGVSEHIVGGVILPSGMHLYVVA